MPGNNQPPSRALRAGLAQLRFLCLLLAFSAGVGVRAAGAGLVQDIRDHGAKPDGVTLATPAINRAVDAAAAAGGGTVYVPAGRFLTGTIYLKSNVTLELAAGAVLLGSTELSDYPENPPPEPTDTVEFRRYRHLYPQKFEYGRYSLIYSAGQENVAVVGRGTIDLQGDHPNFSKAELVKRGRTRQQAHFERPYGLSFVRCRNVQVRDIVLRKLAFWTQDYLDCDDVRIEGITVDSLEQDRNNDGIDIDGSRRVRVANCLLNAGDDAICLKANYRDCEDIVITNCVASSFANGVKFGTASNGGFKNIAISNLTLRKVGCAGLAFEAVDGGTIDGVVVSNVTMHEVGTAIFIRLGDRGSVWMNPEDHAVAQVRNISISNVVANVFTPYDGRPLASSISGLPGHCVENVSLANIRLNILRDYPAEVIKMFVPEQIPEQPAEYPEHSMFGGLPAYALYARHVRGLSLHQVEATFAQRDPRSALVCDDVQGLRISNWTSRVAPESAPVIRLAAVKDAVISGGAASAGTATFLRVEGESGDIALAGIDLGRAREAVSLAPGLPGVTVRR